MWRDTPAMGDFRQRPRALQRCLQACPSHGSGAGAVEVAGDAQGEQVAAEGQPAPRSLPPFPWDCHNRAPQTGGFRTGVSSPTVLGAGSLRPMCQQDRSLREGTGQHLPGLSGSCHLWCSRICGGIVGSLPWSSHGAPLSASGVCSSLFIWIPVLQDPDLLQHHLVFTNCICNNPMSK